jgi:hypothetical protein
MYKKVKNLKSNQISTWFFDKNHLKEHYANWEQLQVKQRYHSFSYLLSSYSEPVFVLTPDEKLDCEHSEAQT